MKLADLAKELNISAEAIKKFIQDFNLQLEECIATNFEVKPDFEKFARENADFLHLYQDDLNKNKSAEDIAEIIHKPLEKVQDAISQHHANIYDNGLYKSSVSSYSIDNRLGGNYHFVYDYFGHKTSLQQRDFIGYRDLFFYISDALEPFISNDQKSEWGISKPAGIILYGPPGSGKIFWANKISEIIGYQFKEVKKHYLGTSYSNGDRQSFNDFLIRMMKEDKVLLFMEDFDEIMGEKPATAAYSTEDQETKEIILHYIGKFEDEDIMMVGAAESLENIDTEVLAPGRFDVLIPVFPPNLQERKEIILYYMTQSLTKDSALMQILIQNNADHLPFWEPVASRMKVFSITMLIDFTQSLKKKIRSIYKESNNRNIRIDNAMIDGALRDASAKLTDDYLNSVAKFLRDASANSYDGFQKRLKNLRAELEVYKVPETPRAVIGFHHNEEGSKSR